MKTIWGRGGGGGNNGERQGWETLEKRNMQKDGREAGRAGGRKKREELTLVPDRMLYVLPLLRGVHSQPAPNL